jgi:hypothetical protein
MERVSLREPVSIRIKAGQASRKRYSLRMADYDLAVIGGGERVSVARDAAGRGLRVILLEQGDLGAGIPASPRLIHGDLSVLERRASSAFARRSSGAMSGCGPRRIWCARCDL